MFFLGLDLGQSTDYTALAILEKIAGDEPVYHCRHLQRFKLGTTYPDIVKALGVMVKRPELEEGYRIIADATGVGRPVIDLLHLEGLVTIAVTIIGGYEVSGAVDDYHVPKRDLVSNLQVLFQNGRVKFAEGLPEVQTLIAELLAFQVKITQSANDIYGAWREGTHDDLVLAVALAAWYAERDRTVWYMS